MLVSLYLSVCTVHAIDDQCHRHALVENLTQPISYKILDYNRNLLWRVEIQVTYNNRVFVDRAKCKSMREEKTKKTARHIILLCLTGLNCSNSPIADCSRISWTKTRKSRRPAQIYFSGQKRVVNNRQGGLVTNSIPIICDSNLPLKREKK